MSINRKNLPPNRTIGPLHFEDIEPHRFEDMVRQLIYEFKPWQSLEATGRSGRDEGFDVRAWEKIVEGENEVVADEDTNENDSLITKVREEKLWLIQCKREKTITPKKMASYLEDIANDKQSKIYGIIFVAACDFSKKTRDIFREKCRNLGFSESYLWGKGELEDLLFQPKNDNLLFAYFGISLQIKQRSLKSQINAKLVIKRKASKLFRSYQKILLRDAEDTRYPFLEDDKKKNRTERGHWIITEFKQCRSDGIHTVGARYNAYLDPKTGEWDYAENVNEAELTSYEDPWAESGNNEEQEEKNIIMDEWYNLPNEKKAMLEVYYIVPYENILAIDEMGDEFFKNPHIYTVPWKSHQGLYLPFLTLYEAYELRNIGSNSSSATVDPDKRIEVFPRLKEKSVV